MTTNASDFGRIQNGPVYRIGDGGLLRRFERASRLTRLHFQIAAALLLTWFPVMGLSLLQEYRTGQPEAMIYDPLVHVRLLVAIPVFFIIDDLFPTVCGYVLTLLKAQNFVPMSEKARLERILERGAKLADSSLPELVLGVLCVSLGVATLRGDIAIDGIDPRRLTPAQIWYAITDLPLFQFLLWRSLWRWAIWVRILAGISRIKLALVPTHPDRRGGIRFLRLPSLGYCALLLFAISSVLCAGWGSHFTSSGTVTGFAPLLLAFGAAGMLIAFGPLLLFARALHRAKRDGLAEVGDVATAYGRKFREQCRDATHERDGVDMQALASVEQVYRETVDQLKVVLFDKQDLAILLLATLLPVLPLMLAHVPFEDWEELLQILTGLKR